MNDKAPTYLCGSKVTSPNEDKRQTTRTKDAPAALIAQEIPAVLGAVSQEPWTKSKCTFTISHNITPSCIKTPRNARWKITNILSNTLTEILLKEVPAAKKEKKETET